MSSYSQGKQMEYPIIVELPPNQQTIDYEFRSTYHTRFNTPNIPHLRLGFGWVGSFHSVLTAEFPSLYIIWCAYIFHGLFTNLLRTFIDPTILGI